MRFCDEVKGLRSSIFGEEGIVFREVIVIRVKELVNEVASVKDEIFWLE